MYNYLEEHKILNKLESGFRPLHSTVTALLDVTNTWYLNMDNGLTNAVLLIPLIMKYCLAKWSVMGFEVRAWSYSGII